MYIHRMEQPMRINPHTYINSPGASCFYYPNCARESQHPDNRALAGRGRGACPFIAFIATCDVAK